jgi:hypothetical protein
LEQKAEILGSCDDLIWHPAPTTIIRCFIIVFLRALCVSGFDLLGVLGGLGGSIFFLLSFAPFAFMLLTAHPLR